ncbi:MAG: CRTAC1 family protein [Gemmataceae bacterium]
MKNRLVQWSAGVTVLATILLIAWGCRPQSNTVQPVDAPDPDLTGPDFFDDVTPRSGIDFALRNGEDVAPKNMTILESLGGGIALFDYDGDGLLDVYIPGGGTFEGPDKKQITGLPGRLYKNLGGFKFRDVTAEVGLDQLAGGRPWFYSHAAAAADYNRSGFPSLLVTGWGRIALFQNVDDGKGGRRFQDVSAEVGLDKGITWATSAAWADLDADGYPDLYVCQYVDWSWSNDPECNYDGKTRDVCPPKKFDGLQHKLFQNIEGKKFVDITAEVGLHKGDRNSSKGLGVLIVDVNGDGKPDIYVANDTVPKFLYINRSSPGKIRLVEEGMLSGAACDGSGQANGSMGLDAGDPAGVGQPWLWVTNYENELHALYKNQCTRDRTFFNFFTPAAGIAAIGQKYVGWGTGFVDLDHHGWEDLFIVNGHAIRRPTGAERRQKPVLLRNREGRFKDVSARGGSYFQAPHLARGAALGDLDNDGNVDAVICHINEPVVVLRNANKTSNHWLGIALEGKGHADVVGAKVVLEAGGRKQTRFAKGGGSYASTPDRRHVFGLADTGKIDKLTVTWPNGDVQEWSDLSVDRYHVLVQGQKDAREPGAKK